MNNQENQKESDIDLSKFFERREKEKQVEPLEPSKKGIKGLWQEMDKKTRFYIYLTIISISLIFTVFLLRSFFS